MRKPIRIAVLAGTAGVIVAGGTAAAFAFQGDSQPTQATTTAYNPAPAAPKAAETSPAPAKAAGKVTAAQARQIALHRAGGGWVTETDFDHEHGTAVWEVDVTTQQRHYEFHIDAATGKVLSLSAAKASATHTSQPTPANAAGKVTAAQARQIALHRAGGGTVTETKFDHEHGKAVWEVDVTGQHGKAEVHINAATGKVLSVHYDAEMGDNH
jgi:uncharacterized membrane protein YkoI